MSFSLEESYVVSVEHSLGARLPESYRQAMQLANGGELIAADDDWQLHPIADTSERRRLTRSANHVLQETSALKGWPAFPRAALAIAANGVGDALVFLRRQGEFEPCVYAWSHSTGTLAKVADDFSELTRA